MAQCGGIGLLFPVRRPLIYPLYSGGCNYHSWEELEGERGEREGQCGRGKGERKGRRDRGRGERKGQCEIGKA